MWSDSDTFSFSTTLFSIEFLCISLKETLSYSKMTKHLTKPRIIFAEVLFKNNSGNSHHCDNRCRLIQGLHSLWTRIQKCHQWKDTVRSVRFDGWNKLDDKGYRCGLHRTGNLELNWNKFFITWKRNILLQHHPETGYSQKRLLKICAPNIPGRQSFLRPSRRE